MRAGSSAGGMWEAKDSNVTNVDNPHM